MIFVYKKWENFVKYLDEKNIHSITASSVLEDSLLKNYLVLKHDVETDVKKAYALAKIEHKYFHKGSYYVQAYLMNNPENIRLLKEIQAMGHEVSYHYDVLDSCNGDIEKALLEFQNNLEKFEQNGFSIKTVCQHGNPIIERIGYTSNRDFFRSPVVQKKYSEITDIMVDFKIKANTDYSYFSDAGRKFKMIFDPINNDIINSDDKNIEYENLEDMLCDALKNNAIISTHPHRWTNSVFIYRTQSYLFSTVKFMAKLLVKIPIIKKFMSKYYYLAKKI